MYTPSKGAAARLIFTRSSGEILCFGIVRNRLSKVKQNGMLEVGPLVG